MQKKAALCGRPLRVALSLRSVRQRAFVSACQRAPRATSLNDLLPEDGSEFAQLSNKVGELGGR